MCRHDHCRALAVCLVKHRPENDLRDIAAELAVWRRFPLQAHAAKPITPASGVHRLQREGGMAAVVVIDNPFATLWYHPEKRIIHHRIHQFISGTAFRELLLTGTDILTKNQATKWLSDDRMNAVLRPEDVEWSHEHWFPQTALAGWKWWAIVQPEKTVGQVTMKNLAATYGQYGITSKGFTDPNDALWWLESQP